MSYVPTIISAAVGDKSGGKPAANKAEDVKKVQALLRKVFGSAAAGLTDGVCDAAMKNAILAFQRVWAGSADGTIDPNGQGLKRLDRLANPVELKPITLGRVLDNWKDGKMTSNGGGYNIAVRTCDGGPLPPASSGFTLHLAVQSDVNSIDVSGNRLDDLMSKDNLGELLKIFDRLGLWAVPVQCQVQLRYRGQAVSTSSPRVLTTPVQPHNGKLVPLDESGNGPKLTYQGDAEAGDFHGRMFVQVPGYDKFLFVYAGCLETHNSFRGFDCVTYAGTACGASNMHMADSADLAQSLGAMPCSVQRKVKDPKTGKETTSTVTLEQADPADVKAFFAQTAGGSFLLWSSGHIVLVVDGEVHEFKASAPAGYACTAVSTWLEPYKTKKLTLRSLAGRPARAA